MKKFIVINASTGPSRQPYVHSSLESAQDEAGKLSVQSPGSKIYVLQVIGYMQHNRGRWTSAGVIEDRRDMMRADCIMDAAPRYVQHDDEIPF